MWGRPRGARVRALIFCASECIAFCIGDKMTKAL